MCQKRNLFEIYRLYSINVQNKYNAFQHIKLKIFYTTFVISVNICISLKYIKEYIVKFVTLINIFELFSIVSMDRY